MQIIIVKLQSSRILQSTSSCFDSSPQSDDTFRKATHELINCLDSLWGHYISPKYAYIWISRIRRLKTSASLTARQSLILCCVQGKQRHSFRVTDSTELETLCLVVFSFWTCHLYIYWCLYIHCFTTLVHKWSSSLTSWWTDIPAWWASNQQYPAHPSSVDSLCHKCARFNLLGLEIVGRVRVRLSLSAQMGVMT